MQPRNIKKHRFHDSYDSDLRNASPCCMPRAIACTSAPTIRAFRGPFSQTPLTHRRGGARQAPSFYGRDGRGAQSWAIQKSMIHGSKKHQKAVNGSEMNPDVSSVLCFLVHWISPYTFSSEAGCRVEMLPQHSGFAGALGTLRPCLPGSGVWALEKGWVVKVTGEGESNTSLMHDYTS